MTEECKPSAKINRKRRRHYDPLTGNGHSDPVESAEATPVEEEPAMECQSTEMVKTQTRPASAGALKIVRNYAALSAGTALLPIPLVDGLAVVALETVMLKKLCEYYGLEFQKEKIASFVGALTGGVHAGLLTASFLKSIPILGLALAPIAAASGAITYAVGVVFMKHFDMGGTLFNFNPASWRKAFEEARQQGKAFVKQGVN